MTKVAFRILLWAYLKQFSRIGALVTYMVQGLVCRQKPLQAILILKAAWLYKNSEIYLNTRKKSFQILDSYTTMAYWTGCLLDLYQARNKIIYKQNRFPT